MAVHRGTREAPLQAKTHVRQSLGSGTVLYMYCMSRQLFM